MFNKDQAARLRDLAEKQGVAHKEEPLTYSAIIGEDRQGPGKDGLGFSAKGIIIVAAGLLVAGIILGALFLFQQKDDKYKEIVKAINQEGSLLKAQVAAIYEKTKQLENDLTLNEGRNQELASQLKNLDGANVSLNNQIIKLAVERKALLQQVADTREKAKELEQAKIALQKSQAQIQENTSQTQKVVSALEGKIATLNTRLQQKIQDTGADTQAQPGVSGVQIVMINRQDGFALINAGTRNGYKKGLHLVVLNHGAIAGELVVNEARDQVSACDIVSETDSLTLGQEVRVK